jgi:acetyl esterase/lipase
MVPPPTPVSATTSTPIVDTEFTSNTVLSGRSLSLDKPANVQVGDLLLIIVGNDSRSNTDQWNNSSLKPDGFTLINESGNRTDDCHVAAFYRVVDGSESSSLSVPAQSTRDYWGYYIRVAGADTVDPIRAIGSDTNTASTASNIVIPGIVTSEDESLVFYNHCFDGGDANGFTVSGNGWAESSEINAGTSGRHASGSWGTKEQAGQGDTGTATIASANRNDGFSGFQFAVSPSATPPTNRPPTADAGPDLTNSLGLVTGFDGNGSADPDGTIVSHDWDFGDGSTGTGAATSHIFAAVGSYTVTLAVADDDGGVASDVVEVTVTEPAPVVPEAPVLQGVDNPTQIAFDNARQDNLSPTIRASAVHTTNYDRFQIELNTTADFSGTAYGQLVTGSYISGVSYNVVAADLSPGLPTTDNATYYVRVRASADDGALWGDWSAGVWTYTYRGNGDPDWFQSTDEQMATGSLVDTATTGTDRVGLAISPEAPVGFADSFDRSDSTNVGSPWDELLGNWRIRSQTVGMSDGTLGALRYDQDLGSTDHWAQATLGNYGGGQIGIILRFDASAATGYVAHIDDGIPKLMVATNGDSLIHSSVGPAHTPTVGTTYRAEVEGNQIRFYAGQELLHSWTDNTISGNSRSGLFFDGDAIAGWDNFSTDALAAGSQSASGTITSRPIDFDNIVGSNGWGTFDWSEDETNGSISTQLLYTNTAPCDSVVPSGALANNESGHTAGPINMSGLDTATYHQLCLRATLTDSGDGTPYLLDWSVGWLFGVPPPNSPPMANAGPDLTAYVDQTIDVDGGASADSDGAIVSYSWDFGDGNTAIGATANHTYAAAGVYTVTLTVADDDGATGVDAAEVAVADPPPNTDAVDYINVAYGSDPRQRLDLAVPQGAGPFPIIFWIHGGHWIEGDKSENPFDYYTQNGFAVASTNYRFAGGGNTHVELADDIEAAFNLVAGGSIDSRIDSGRMVISGFSAGGHLSALTALTRDVQVAGVMTFGGPMELMFSQRVMDALVDTGYTLPEAAGILEPVLGCLLPDGCTAGEDVAASPTQQVTSNAPPFHIQQGLADDINPPEMAVFMAEALTGAGVQHTLEQIPGLYHFVSITSSVDQFLNQVTGS